MTTELPPNSIGIELNPPIKSLPEVPSPSARLAMVEQFTTEHSEAPAKLLLHYSEGIMEGYVVYLGGGMFQFTLLGYLNQVEPEGQA